MADATERLLKTEKKTVVLEALGDGKFSLSAQGIDKPITIMADEVFEVRANAKQFVLLRKSRNYDPSDHDAIVGVPSCVTEPVPSLDQSAPEATLTINLSEGAAGDA